MSTPTAPSLGQLVIIDGTAYTITDTNERRTTCMRYVETAEKGRTPITTTVGTHALQWLGLDAWGLEDRLAPPVRNPAAVQIVPATGSAS